MILEQLKERDAIISLVDVVLTFAINVVKYLKKQKKFMIILSKNIRAFIVEQDDKNLEF